MDPDRDTGTERLMHNHVMLIMSSLSNTDTIWHTKVGQCTYPIMNFTLPAFALLISVGNICLSLGPKMP